MVRPLRIEYPGAWYHVMNRGRRAENIFLKEKDYERFLSLLQETSEMFDLRISAYCLMPNHYHLLVQTPSANLSRAMRHINGVYTQRFNRSKEIDGQLFRGRFKSILVEEDSHLLELLRYIHRNPVRAKICQSVSDFNWSSHYGYISSCKDDKWLHKEFLLSMFADSPDRANTLYRKFVDGEDSQDILDFYGKKNLSSFFGSLEFVQMIKAKYRSTKEDSEVPQSKQLAPTVIEIKNIVSNIYGVEEKAFMKSIRGQVNEPRNVAIYLSRKRSGLSLQDIGSQFNLAKYSSVSSIVCRTERQLLRDRKFSKKMKKILKQLDKSQAKI